jgi:hypothetical protein
MDKKRDEEKIRGEKKGKKRIKKKGGIKGLKAI